MKAAMNRRTPKRFAPLSEQCWCLSIVSPRDCVAFMGKLQDLEQKDGASFTLMSTHPKASDRIANMQTWIAGNFNAATYAGSGGAIVKPDSGYADTWDGAAYAVDFAVGYFRS